MIKADKYLKDTLREILENGSVDHNPRAKIDGKPAYSLFVTQKVFQYDINKGEYPITTLRNTPLKGAFYDIEAIYIKQTNILEDMHPSIHSWWKDFCREKNDYKATEESLTEKLGKSGTNLKGIGLTNTSKNEDYHSLGATYGHTVRRYDLMNKLLKGLKENPFGRRHSINLNQEQEKVDDPQALPPCAFETLWTVRDKIEKIWGDKKITIKIRYIDLTLIQRSQDFLMVSSINPLQYTMLGMMVCGHLSKETGITHKLGKLTHFVQNCHIYLAHKNAAKEILEKEPLKEQPTIKLKENKNFYDYNIDDFEIYMPQGITKLKSELKLAI